MDEEEDRILDLVYLNVYVHFSTQRVQGALVHTTSSFAVFKKGRDRTRREPLDTKGYQTLDTGWGLGRIRAQEGENLDSAVVFTMKFFLYIRDVSRQKLKKSRISWNDTWEVEQLTS